MVDDDDAAADDDDVEEEEGVCSCLIISSKSKLVSFKWWRVDRGRCRLSLKAKDEIFFIAIDVFARRYCTIFACLINSLNVVSRHPWIIHQHWMFNDSSAPSSFVTGSTIGRKGVCVCVCMYCCPDSFTRLQYDTLTRYYVQCSILVAGASVVQTNQFVPSFVGLSMCVILNTTDHSTLDSNEERKRYH